MQKNKELLNRKIYILLTGTSTLFAKSIRLYTKKSFSHASISIDENLYYFYSFSRKYKRNPFIGCFSEETFDTGVYSMYQNIPCIILEINISEKQYIEVKKILEHFEENKSTYSYNYVGILYGLKNKPYSKDNKFFCSEFVYYVLKEAKILNNIFDDKCIEPSDFLNLNYKIKYQGNFQDLYKNA